VYSRYDDLYIKAMASMDSFLAVNSSIVLSLVLDIVSLLESFSYHLSASRSEIHM